MDALRLRLEEKESLLSKKSTQISEMTEEKSTHQGEISDLKDMLDVKERKVNVLQKKVKKQCTHTRCHCCVVALHVSQIAIKHCEYYCDVIVIGFPVGDI